MTPKRKRRRSGGGFDLNILYRPGALSEQGAAAQPHAAVGPPRTPVSCSPAAAAAPVPSRAAQPTPPGCCRSCGNTHLVSQRRPALQICGSRRCSTGGKRGERGTLDLLEKSARCGSTSTAGCAPGQEE